MRKSLLLVAIASVAVLLGSIAPIASATTGIECSCGRTGAYVSPNEGAPPTVGAGGASPGGIYTVSATGGGVSGIVNLAVTRNSDNAQRLQTAIPSSAGWGFSPDDHRFVYHYVQSGVDNVILYDLQNMRTLWQGAVATGSSRIQFSPHGKSLLYAAITAPLHTSLTLIDTSRSSSNTLFQTEFTMFTPPGNPGDTFDVAGWGWGPDDNDRTFIYGYVYSQNAVNFSLLNLQATGNKQVYNTTFTVISAFWQFDPCGDVLGIVTQPFQTQVQTQLIRTENGSNVATAQQTFPIATVNLRTTNSAHIANVGGTDYQLAANSAGIACGSTGGTVTLTGLSVNPNVVRGGTNSTGRVTLSGPAPAGGTRVYLGVLSGATAARVPFSILIPGGSSSGTFVINTNVVTNSIQVNLLASVSSNYANSQGAILTVQPTPPPVTGNAMRSGFNSINFPGNDDDSVYVPSLGFSINFFGRTFNSLWLNNNGNLTFDAPLPTFTPFPLQSTNRIIIAPYFADVDTRVGNTVHYGPGTVNGRPAWGATWPGVGCYATNIRVLDDFQVILIERADTGAGNFDIEYDFNRIQWEAGQASGGNALCLGGSPGRVGWSNGINTSFELPGSGQSGYFLDTTATGAPNPTALISNSLNSLQPGRFLWNVRNGTSATGATITGAVYLNSAAPANAVSGALVQICGPNGICNLTSTNSDGRYSLGGFPAGTYTIRGTGTGNTTPTSVSITVSGNGTFTAPNIIFVGPTPPQPGTTVTNRGTNPNGLPIIYWNDTETLSKRACPGGTASYQIQLAGDGIIRQGPMTEGPAGVYTATFAALYPNHGYATITITVNCPGGTRTTETFDVYIDPSGIVRTTTATPIAGATVSLYRSDTSSGPFELVPDGSPVMSVTNRANPDVTSPAGLFGWDVVQGFYKVRAEATDCHAPGNPSQAYVETSVLSIPPAVTDLVLVLECGVVDTTPPVSTISANPTANAAGWNNQNVVVNLTATGGASGVQSVNYSATGAQPIGNTVVPGSSTQFTISNEGTTTISYFAKSNAGIQENARTLTIKLDKTPPTVTCGTPPQFFRGQTGTSVSATVSDTLSGPVATSLTAPASTTTVGSFSVPLTGADVAGNTTTVACQYQVVDFSLAFDGATGYAEVPATADLNPSGDWTVEMWFKDDDAFGFNHEYVTLLSKGDIDVDPESPYYVTLGRGEMLVGQRGGWIYYQLHIDLSIGVDPTLWHHVAVTYNATTLTLTAYLDGVQVGQGVFQAGSVGNTLPLQMGRNGAVTGKYMKGKFDDVRLWSLERSPSDISGSYRTELTGPQPGLLANWRFDEGSGGTATDTAGAHNATLNGGASYSTDVHP